MSGFFCMMGVLTDFFQFYSTRGITGSWGRGAFLGKQIVNNNFKGKFV